MRRFQRGCALSLLSLAFSACSGGGDSSTTASSSSSSGASSSGGASSGSAASGSAASASSSGGASGTSSGGASSGGSSGGASSAASSTASSASAASSAGSGTSSGGASSGGGSSAGGSSSGGSASAGASSSSGGGGPSGDTCETAIPLTSGVATPGITIGATDDYDICGGATPGRDRVYSITIPARNKLDVTVECLEGFAGPCDSALRAFWLVDSAISSCGSDMVCAQATTSSFTSTLSYSNPSANPRQVFIIVDVLLADEFWTNMDGGAESALYDIRYNITATNSALAPVPPGDTCWNATRVTVPFDQSSLTVAGFADDVEAERSMCTTLASVLARKDRFYAVTIPGTHAITATLTPASGMSLNPGLALVAPTGDCMDLNTTAMKGCITSASNFDDVVTTLSWRNPDTTPVEAFVIVEGASDTAAFRLQIDVVDAARPANDTCATAEAVTLMDCGAGDGSLCGAVTADTTFANADYFDTRAECGGYPNMPSFPDVAWVLTLPAGRTLSWMTMAEGSMSQANGMLIAGPDPAACSPSSGSRVCLPTNSSGNLGSYTNATGADQTLFFVLRGGGCSTEACFGGALSANFVVFQ